MKFRDIEKLQSKGYEERLFHISFRKFDREVWAPRPLEGGIPDGEYEYDPENPQLEPSFARISVAPTPLGCVQAMWKNIKHLFDEHDVVHANLYEVRILKSTKVIRPELLTSNNLVQDAHMTGEVWILSPVEVRFQSFMEIAIDPKKMNDLLTYSPFEDSSLPDEDLGPKSLTARGRIS